MDSLWTVRIGLLIKSYYKTIFHPWRYRVSCEQTIPRGRIFFCSRPFKIFCELCWCKTSIREFILSLSFSAQWLKYRYGFGSSIQPQCGPGSRELAQCGFWSKNPQLWYPLCCGEIFLSGPRSRGSLLRLQLQYEHFCGLWFLFLTL